jgi:hypothetical protein
LMQASILELTSPIGGWVLTCLCSIPRYHTRNLRRLNCNPQPHRLGHGDEGGEARVSTRRQGATRTLAVEGTATWCRLSGDPRLEKRETWGTRTLGSPSSSKAALRDCRGTRLARRLRPRQLDMMREKSIPLPQPLRGRLIPKELRYR